MHTGPEPPARTEISRVGRMASLTAKALLEADERIPETACGIRVVPYFTPLTQS